MRTPNHTAFAVPVSPSLNQFSREVDRLFSTLWQQQGAPAARQGIFPPLNLWEDQQHIVIEAELPGIAMDDIELTIHGDQLTLRGERKPAAPGSPGKPGTPLRQERWHGKFERTITIPVDVDDENASASLQHGVLTITLPKAASARPRRIEIGAARQAG